MLNYVDFVYLSTLALFSLLIVWQDLKLKIIPNKYLLVLSVVTLFYAVIRFIDGTSPNSLKYSVTSGVICFLIFLIFYLFKPSGIGAGDVKLAGTIGLIIGQFGIELAVICVLASFIFSLPVTSIKLIQRKQHEEFAFGPFLILSLWVFFLLLEK